MHESIVPLVEMKAKFKLYVQKCERENLFLEALEEIS